NSTSSGRPERLAGRVITTEAASAIPDGVLAAEMAADQDPQPGARAAAGLFGELQRHAVRGHDVVAPDGAFVLDAKDLVEIGAVPDVGVWTAQCARSVYSAIGTPSCSSTARNAVRIAATLSPPSRSWAYSKRLVASSTTAMRVNHCSGSNASQRCRLPSRCRS